MIEQSEYLLCQNHAALDANQKEALQQFMESKPSISRYSSKFENNWEVICFIWDYNNSNTSISDDAEMPDYTELQDK